MTRAEGTRPLIPNKYRGLPKAVDTNERARTIRLPLVTIISIDRWPKVESNQTRNARGPAPSSPPLISSGPVFLDFAAEQKNRCTSASDLSRCCSIPGVTNSKGAGPWHGLTRVSNSSGRGVRRGGRIRSKKTDEAGLRGPNAHSLSSRAFRDEAVGP